MSRRCDAAATTAATTTTTTSITTSTTTSHRWARAAHISHVSHTPAHTHTFLIPHHVAQVGVPIAVRSSSMFEDAFLQPFAGVYSSFMLPNDGGEEQRLAQLEGAVKRVYASTFCQAARGYIASTQNRLEEEKMAIIVQELVGEADGHGHFHPSLAGVANSIDFYPRPHTSHEHGCAQLSLGLGAAVVGGTPSVQFSLADPAMATVIGGDWGGLQVSALDLTPTRSPPRGSTRTSSKSCRRSTRC